MAPAIKVLDPIHAFAFVFQLIWELPLQRLKHCIPMYNFIFFSCILIKMSNHTCDFFRDASFDGVFQTWGNPRSVVQTLYIIWISFFVKIWTFLTLRLDSLSARVKTWSVSFQEAPVSRVHAGFTIVIDEAMVSQCMLEDFLLSQTVSDPWSPCIGFPDAGLLESWSTLLEFFSFPCNEKLWFTIVYLCTCHSFTNLSHDLYLPKPTLKTLESSVIELALRCRGHQEFSQSQHSILDQSVDIHQLRHVVSNPHHFWISCILCTKTCTFPIHLL